MNRPAETGTAAGATAVVIGYALGIQDPEVILSLAVVIGLLPAAITFVVNLRRNKQQFSPEDIKPLR